MKKLIFFLLFAASIQILSGQIKSAQITYSMDYSADEESEDGESVASFFEGSSMSIYFNPSMMRTDIVFGLIMDMKVIINYTGKNGLILMSTFGSNFAVPATLDQILDNGSSADEKPVLELVSGTKKILKYKCKKALQTDAAGNVTTIWYSEKFKVPVSYFGVAQDIPGLPLEIESNNSGVRIVFTATEIKKGEPEEGTFSLDIPEGYEEMSYEEFSSMGEE